MAQLRNIEKVWKADPGTIVTVGHNRTIELDDRFYCRLHGHAVAIEAARDGSSDRLVQHYLTEARYYDALAYSN